MTIKTKIFALSALFGAVAPVSACGQQETASDQATALSRARQGSEQVTYASAESVPQNEQAARSGFVEAGKLFVLGDSYSLSEHFRVALEAELPEVEIVWDSVGGSSLAEQYSRLRTRADTDGMPLLILDGGLTDFNPMEQITAIVGEQNPRCGLWFYVEPVRRAYPTEKIQKRRMRVFDRLLQSMEETYPGHTIRWNDQIIAAADGGPIDEVSIEQGLVPESMRTDTVHLNQRGFRMLAQIVAQAIRERAPAENCT